MAWESRPNGKCYLYRSFRDADGRVRKRYLGTGARGQLAFQAWKGEKEATKNQRAEAKRRSEDEQELEDCLRQIDKLTAKAVSEFFLKAGFHNPKSRGLRRLRRR
jgi:hypothetical protein